MRVRYLFSVSILVASSVLADNANDQVYKVIRSGDNSAVEGLIRTGGVNSRDRRGNTPLMIASAIGSVDAVKLLVAAGADVNARNAFDATALMWATGDVEKVRLLLAHGADVNARSKLGRSALLIAAFRSGASEVVKLLVDAGADLKIQDGQQFSVVEAAVQASDSASVRFLLAKGAPFDLRDYAGITPLLMAAQVGNPEIMKMLLDKGAKPDAAFEPAPFKVKNGDIAIGLVRPLMLAAGMGCYEGVQLLLKAGADVNAKDVRGMNALAFAVATDHPDVRIVRLLLSKGADPKAASRNGATALDWARKYQNPVILKELGIEPESAAAQAPVRLREVADTPAAVRTALEKSLAILQKANANFLNEGGCVACHAQNLTSMAFHAAAHAGVKADSKTEQEQGRMVAVQAVSLEQLMLQLQDPPVGAEGMMYSLEPMYEAGFPAGFSTDSLVYYSAAQQREQGNWPNFGIMRPPMEDDDFLLTAFGIRMLQEYPLPARKAEYDDRINRARGWLERSAPHTTTDRAMQLLGIKWAKGDVPAQRVRELMAQQRPDGGWAQTPFLASDAFGTGMVLCALFESGTPSSDPAFRRGIEYLLRTQSDDGSWHVKTRAAGFQPYFQSGFPHGHDQWISSAGTAWAAMALAHSLPASMQTANVHYAF